MTRAVLLLALLCLTLPAAAQDLFAPIFAVTQHPRCSNCHTDTAVPLQREARPHQPSVPRGPDGKGIGAQACIFCHKAGNVGPAPGAPDWRSPKAGEAVFRNRDAGALCRALRDPLQNGGLEPERLGQHFAEDPLIGWAWAPGGNRSTPPLPRDHLVVAVANWLRAGAPCPD
jgi:hypothetical protein